MFLFLFYLMSDTYLCDWKFALTRQAAGRRHVTWATCAATWCILSFSCYKKLQVVNLK